MRIITNNMKFEDLKVGMKFRFKHDGSLAEISRIDGKKRTFAVYYPDLENIMGKTEGIMFWYETDLENMDFKGHIFDEDVKKLLE